MHGDVRRREFRVGTASVEEQVDRGAVGEFREKARKRAPDAAERSSLERPTIDRDPRRWRDHAPLR
jgi:hypothetical protein